MFADANVLLFNRYTKGKKKHPGLSQVGMLRNKNQKNYTTKLFFANVLLFCGTCHLFEEVNVIIGVFSVDFKFKPDNAICYII